MNRKIKKYLPRISIIVFFLGFSFLFYYSSPEQLINFIGVENAYLLILILAFLGGLSTFAGVPYHLVLITLATGGANPLLLGTATAVGVMLGDSTSYFIGYEGRDLIPGKLQNILERIFAFGSRFPRSLPVFFFLYGSLTPFSNDVVVISAGLAKYPFKKVMIPLALGNLVFNISLAYLSNSAYSLLQKIFS